MLGSVLKIKHFSARFLEPPRLVSKLDFRPIDDILSRCEDCFVASESTFYRILRAENQLAHRRS